MSQLTSNICLSSPVKLPTGQSDSPHAFDSILFASMLKNPPASCLCASVVQQQSRGAPELLPGSSPATVQKEVVSESGWPTADWPLCSVAWGTQPSGSTFWWSAEQKWLYLYSVVLSEGLGTGLPYFYLFVDKPPALICCICSLAMSLKLLSRHQTVCRQVQQRYCTSSPWGGREHRMQANSHLGHLRLAAPTPVWVLELNK